MLSVGPAVLIELPEPPEDSIDLAALIDCVFLLLIFFMVTTTLKSEEGVQVAKNLRIEVPRAATVQGSSVSAPQVIVGVNAQGGYLLDGIGVGISSLHQRMKELASTAPSTHVIIEGDGRVPYQQVAHLLELCQFVGLQSVSARMR